MIEPEAGRYGPESKPETRTIADIDRSVAELTVQLTAVIERLDRAAGETHSGYYARAANDHPCPTASRVPRMPLPDPRLIRRIIRQRQLRARFFDANLFADPAWDMLLDLTAARAEYKRISVTSLCIASGVPSTTALRWITVLAEAGLLERQEDELDRRRVLVELTDEGANAMSRYFSTLS